MEHKTQTYKGFTIRQTETTCNIIKTVFGEPYGTTAKIYEIEGLKSAGTLPFITSIREAKEFINKSLSPEDLTGVEIPELDFDEIDEMWDIESN